MRWAPPPQKPAPCVMPLPVIGTSCLELGVRRAFECPSVTVQQLRLCAALVARLSLRNFIEKILARSSQRQVEPATTVPSRLKDVQKPGSLPNEEDLDRGDRRSRNDARRWHRKCAGHANQASASSQSCSSSGA